MPNFTTEGELNSLSLKPTPTRAGEYDAVLFAAVVRLSARSGICESQREGNHDRDEGLFGKRSRD